MASDPEDGDVPLGQSMRVDPTAEIADVMDDLEGLLKNGDVIAALTDKGVNASLALLAVDALRSYLAGEKAQAADDFGAVADEILGRLAGSSGS
jgi:hypothetical protein